VLDFSAIERTNQRKNGSDKTLLVARRNGTTLTENQLKSAVRKAVENAGMLIREAEILFGNECWARAVFLAQIASEEIGKADLMLFARVNLVEGKLDWTGFWEKVTQHRSKLGVVVFLEKLGEIVNSDRPIEDELRKLDDRVARQDRAKMASLYSDVNGCTAVLPSELATQECAAECLRSARERLQSIETPMTRALYSEEFEFRDRRDEDLAEARIIDQLRATYNSDLNLSRYG
jgi:AbiV family abortive infection protein